MSSINVISGGLDVTTIVEQLMEIERQPEKLMQNLITKNNNKATAFQNLNTRLSTLLNKINKLIYKAGDSDSLLMPSSFEDRLQQSIFSARKAASSDDTLVSATGTQGTASGTYAIAVSSLAQARTMASANVADADTTTFGTGTLSFQIGTDEAVSVTIDSSNNTLTGIRNAINAADAGVTATIINDGSATPYRLIIASNETGSENAFALTDNLSGGTALAMAETQAAGDATFTVNSISITKSSNTISDVIDGVTLDLKAQTASAVTITVSTDIDAIVSAFKELASAYNDLNTFFSSQFTYNAATKTAGLLSGDSTVRGVQSKVQQLFTQSVSNDFTDFGVISQIGFSVGRDGTVTVNETKLRDLLSSDPEGVAGLVLGTEDSLTGEQSILVRMQTALEGITDPLEGPIHNATDSLNRSTSDLNDQISKFEDRMAIVEQQLLDQYNRADQALRLLTVAQASLSSQLSTLSNYK